MKPYYQDEFTTIYHSDAAVLIPQLNLGYVDCLLSDPPYPGYDKGWEVPNVEAILGMVGSRVKIVFWPPTLPAPISYETEHIWHKPNGNSAHHYEKIYVSGIDIPQGCKVFRVAAILPNYTQYRDEAVDHPTQKPIKLIRQLLTKYKVSFVIDPFLGSGTTLRAAKDLGVKGVGIEINERYCEMAAKRMSQEALPLRTPNKHLQGTPQARLFDTLPDGS